MKAYAAYFRIRFTAGLQYRAAALAGVVTQFAWGFLSILLFAAFYRTDPASFPMGFSQLASYLWLRQAFLALFASWIFDGEIFSLIQSGSLAYELVRPLDVYAFWYVKNLALRLSRAVLRSFPILTVAALLPAPYGLSLPAGWDSFGLFLSSAVLSFLLVTAYCMLIYIATVYTLSPLGVRMVAVAVTDLLTGGIIPLPFFPDNVLAVLRFTPFAAMQDLPFRLYSGHVAAGEAAPALALQAFWLMALVVLGRAWLNRGLRKATIQGG